MQGGLGSFLARLNYFHTIFYTLFFPKNTQLLLSCLPHLLLQPSALWPVRVGGPRPLEVLAFCFSLQCHCCHVFVISKSVRIIISVLCVLFPVLHPTTSIAIVLIFPITHILIYDLGFKHPISWLPCNRCLPSWLPQLQAPFNDCRLLLSFPLPFPLSLISCSDSFSCLEAMVNSYTLSLENNLNSLVSLRCTHLTKSQPWLR